MNKNKHQTFEYFLCLYLSFKLWFEMSHNTYSFSITTAAGISWLPRFDSMRGCCRVPHRTWLCISMCVSVRRGGLGVSSGFGHIRRCFLPMLYTSLPASESQSDSNYGCFMITAGELLLQYPDIYGIASSMSRINLFYSWYLAFANRTGQFLQSKH